MEIGVIMTLLSVLSAACGVLISWITFSRRSKRETERLGESRGVMASDIGYIKAGVDDLKRESRETRSDVCVLSERVTRCEESCKQAHKRIDEIHEYKEHNLYNN